MKLFSMDGKFLETFNKITDLVTLNILWLLCCIPIITIGASTSALYQVTLQIAENRDSYITKEFFKAFRENFRQATIVWLAVIVTGFVLLSDMFIISHFFTGSDMFLIGLIPALVMILFHERIIIGTFLLIVIVPALSVFCKSVLLSKLFKTIKVAN